MVPKRMPRVKQTPAELADLLATLIKASGGTKTDFGRAVGLGSSTISHLLSGDPHYALGIEPCLRIAHATGCPPSTLLRAAGKGEIALLIESLYGPAAAQRMPQPEFTIEERRIVTQWRTMPRKIRQALLIMIVKLTASDSPDTQERRRTSPTQRRRA
jgi:transcriptional regulator with XRE-family HTH domain